MNNNNNNNKEIKQDAKEGEKREKIRTVFVLFSPLFWQLVDLVCYCFQGHFQAFPFR